MNHVSDSWFAMDENYYTNQYKEGQYFVIGNYITRSQISWELSTIKAWLLTIKYTSILCEQNLRDYCKFAW